MQADTIQHIGQIGVPIKNLQRAILFYQEKLGLSLYLVQIVWLSLIVTA